MPAVIIRTEYLTVNSIPLATPAWEVTTINRLFDSAPVRGGDRLIPHLPGRAPYRRRIDARPVSLEMVVFGAVDETDTPYEDVRIGLLTNMETLTQGLGIGGATTVPIVWTRADGSTAEADGHVLGLTTGQRLGPSATQALLELLLPVGAFVLVGSGS